MNSLDPDFADLLLDWKVRCPNSEGNWVFPNPNTLTLYHSAPIQQDYIRAAGRRAKVGTLAGIPSPYRRPLHDEVGTPIGVQQNLMRHAHVSTTMDVYGNAQMNSKRIANTKVV